MRFLVCGLLFILTVFVGNASADTAQEAPLSTDTAIADTAQEAPLLVQGFYLGGATDSFFQAVSHKESVGRVGMLRWNQNKDAFLGGGLSIVQTRALREVDLQEGNEAVAITMLAGYTKRFETAEGKASAMLETSAAIDWWGTGFALVPRARYLLNTGLKYAPSLYISHATRTATKRGTKFLSAVGLTKDIGGTTIDFSFGHALRLSVGLIKPITGMGFIPRVDIVKFDKETRVALAVFSAF